MEDSLPPGYSIDNSSAPQEQTNNGSEQPLPEGYSLKEDSLLDRAKAGVEGLERGMTLGLSDIYRTKVEPQFLPKELQTSPEELAANERTFPVTSGIGNIVGGAGLLEATGGLGGLLPEGASLGTKAAAMAGEGAIFGAGNVASEYALGDPDLNAQKIMGEVGLNALIGGAIPFVGAGLSKTWRGFKSLGKGATETLEQAKNLDANGNPPPPPGASPLVSNTELNPAQVVDAPTTGVKPTSMQELMAKNNAARSNGTAVDMPQKAVLLDAASRVAMDNPVHPLQVSSLDDQASRDAYNIIKETPGPEGEALRGHEAEQKKELTGRTEDEIQNLAPDAELTPDATKGGNRAIDFFKQKYQQIQKGAGELIGQFRAFQSQGYDHLNGIVDALTEKMPSLSEMFDTTGDQLDVKPYDPAFGFTRETYGAVKDVVDSLQKNPQDFSKLFNLRDSMSDGVNMLTSGKTRDQIAGLKAAFMDYMQKMVDDSMPNLRDTMRKYAVNEAERGVIEKNFGASVGKPEYGQISKVKPENIGDNIFKNTATTQAAKNILGPKEFGEILANWLTENKEKVTTDGVFSSKMWTRFLKNNSDALNIAFSHNPEALQALKDYATIMRILPDSTSINPSGTAKTLMGMIKGLKGMTDIGGIAHILGESTIVKIQKQIELSNLNEKLAGRAGNASVVQGLKKIIGINDKKISNAANAIFSGKAIAPIVGEMTKDHDIKAMSEKIDKANNNPDSLSKSGASTSDYAPNHSNAIVSNVTNAVSYLASQKPRSIQMGPLDDKIEPSQGQMYLYNRKLGIAQNPLQILQHVKDGTLLPQDTQTLQAIYPKMYQQMSTQLVSAMTEHLSKDGTVPYQLRQSLSLFMGQPLDSTLTPQSIMASQAVYARNQPQQTPQPQTKSKKNTSKLGKLAENMQTPNQSAESRQTET